MPELPAARRDRLIETWGIKDEDAGVLVASPGLADYAERAVAALNGGTPKDVVNWVRQDVLGYLNETDLSPAVLSPEMLAELVGLVASGSISRQQGKDVLDQSLREEKWPRDIVEARGPEAGDQRRRARGDGRRHPRRERGLRRRVPRRRRQGQEEEARFPHGRIDEGHPRAKPAPKS